MDEVAVPAVWLVLADGWVGEYGGVSSVLETQHRVDYGFLQYAGYAGGAVNILLQHGIACY